MNKYKIAAEVFSILLIKLASFFSPVWLVNIISKRNNVLPQTKIQFMEKDTILFHLRKANLVRNIKVFMQRIKTKYTIKNDIRVDKYFYVIES